MNKVIKDKVLEVFYLENKKSERLLFDLALHEIDTPTKSKMAANCDDALDMLDSDTYAPDIIFIDLKMPHKDGFHCLEEIRKNKKFDKVPVVIFSISNSPQDVKDTFKLKANLFVQKPYDI